MAKPLICIVGKSGSGKTTIAERLESKGLKSVQSYTTRPKRNKDETGHTFISPEQYKNIDKNEIIASTTFNGFEYCATATQLNEADIYVVDLAGLDCCERYYEYNCDRKIISVFIDTSTYERYRRMINRSNDSGVGSTAIESALNRIENDAIAFQGWEHNVEFILKNENANDIEKCVNFIYNIWENANNMYF